jgi:hypothetical protein
MNQKEFFIITMTIFLTILGWIVADLYHVSHTQKVEEINARFSQPIKTTINNKVFSELEQRK